MAKKIKKEKIENEVVETTTQETQIKEKIIAQASFQYNGKIYKKGDELLNLGIEVLESLKTKGLI